MIEDKERREDLDDVRSVMAIAAGRRMIWRILEAGRIFQSSFSSDALVTAFHEGQRNAALALWNDVMEAAPERYLTMTKGIQEREARRNERRNSSGDDSFDE